MRFAPKPLEGIVYNKTHEIFKPLEGILQQKLKKDFKKFFPKE